MKIKASTYKFILLGMIIIGFSSCSSSQKLQKEIPFAVTSATCQEWVAGVQGGGSGINVTFVADNLAENNIQLDSIFFRGQKAAVMMLEEKGKKNCSARFVTPKLEKPDIIMHKDPKKEFGNKPPKLQEKIPFELADNEAVISYTQAGKVKYFKIENIKQKSKLFYPSAPPKNQE